jgi:hypothetical protein
LYYTTLFVDGLRDDIRSTVLVQRPSSFDTACTLALLQEEVGDPYRRRDTRRPEPGFSPRPPPRASLPLPTPPRIDKSPASNPVVAESSPLKDSSKFQGDKFASLRAYRRARGLCDRCAEKWQPGHKCSSTVQLNALQEVFDLFSTDDRPETEQLNCPSSDYPQQDLLFMAVSKDVVAGTEGPRTMQLQGSIQKFPMSILVDSGSSHTFISKRLADHLSGVTPLQHTVNVQVANGGLLQCDSYIPNGIWFVNEHSFTSDIKIIPLEHFDFILGMDWLEQSAP